MKETEFDDSKPVKVGLRRGKKLSEMKAEVRLKFIAEGLPLILGSCRGYWNAKCALETHPREAEVIEGFAKEEAAKILILMDAVRCPAKLLPGMIGKLMGWFYDHRTKLIYAEAAHWKTTSLRQLRKYIEPELKSHYPEGDYGEYIVPNSIDYSRQKQLYVDIEQHDDGRLVWSTPFVYKNDFCWNFAPESLNLIESMDALGLFTEQGIRAVSETWGQINFKDNETRETANSLTEKLLSRVTSEKLLKNHAEQAHIDSLYNWQIPMYNLELNNVGCLEELQSIKNLNVKKFTQGN